MSIEILPIVGKFLIPKQIYNTVVETEEDTRRVYLNQKLKVYENFMTQHGASLIMMKLTEHEIRDAMESRVRTLQIIAEKKAIILKTEVSQKHKDDALQAIDDLFTKLNPEPSFQPA